MIGAHLKFHLLKRGVTEATALKLVQASCSVQTFHDACTLTYKDGKVVSAAQAEMDDELEEMQRRALGGYNGGDGSIGKERI